MSAVNGSFAVGTLDAGTEDAKVVRWNTSGEITAVYRYFVSPVAVNGRGHVLSSSSWGLSVWFDAERAADVNSSSGRYFASLTDEGDVYGTVGDETYRTPIRYDCVGG